MKAEEPGPGVGGGGLVPACSAPYGFVDDVR